MQLHIFLSFKCPGIWGKGKIIDFGEDNDEDDRSESIIYKLTKFWDVKLKEGRLQDTGGREISGWSDLERLQ